MDLQFGVDAIIEANPSWKTKRIGLLTNDAARTNKGLLSRQALLQNGFNIILLFSPEHGITTKGADGASMHDGKDPVTGLPIISLYGEKFSPSAQDLQNIDILLFDIPDAGTRFYTYLWSMTYWIEAAAQYNKQVIILDRPNPLGGNFSLAEGPMLHELASSFVGRFSIPVKHQCTLGELAIYFNATRNWNANLEVIKCRYWKRDQLFFDWNLPWVNTSPALQNFEATLLYPGLCFFEATNVSVGRGSSLSFEWIGATWFNLPALAMIWQNMLREDIKIETHKIPIVTGAEITETKGITIKVIDPYHFNAVMTGLLLLKFVRDLHPQDFKWMPYPTNANPTGLNHLSLLLGIPNAENLFEQPLPIWLQHITKLLKVDDWQKQMAPYLLY